MTVKHVTALPDGRMRFRRAWPTDVKDLLPNATYSANCRLDGAALLRWRDEHNREWARMVAIARGELDPTPLQQHETDRAEAGTLLADMQRSNLGLSEDESRSVLADDLAARGWRSGLVRAISAPDLPPPPATLADAERIYRHERIGDDHRAAVRLDRILARVADALGPLRDRPLVALGKADAVAVRDLMLATISNKGIPLSRATVERELKVVTSLVNVGLDHFDIDHKNPFAGLKLPKAATAQAAGDDRDPLPSAVVQGMNHRLQHNARSPDLYRIWHLLEQTGCRLAEVTGLEVADVVLDHAVPHLHIRPNATRRIKVAVSIRLVPLTPSARAVTVDALGALPSAGRVGPLFPVYGRSGGATAASQVLMQHLRKLSPDPRHVIHSLRHNMRDKLDLAGVEASNRQMLLGHKRGGAGDTAYGSAEVRLKVCATALGKAMGQSD